MAADRGTLKSGRRTLSMPVLLLIAGHVALCGFLSHSLSIYIDEAYTLETTSRGPGYAYSQALGFELQPPLYFVSLSLWRGIDDSLFVARLFSTLCTTASLFVLALVARRFLPKLHPAWLVGAAAFNPILLYAATEARCYGLAMLIGSLLLLFFHDAFLVEKTRRRWPALVAFSLSAIAGLHTFYFLGFQLVGLAAGLLVLKRWHELRTYLLNMVIVGAAFVPQAIEVSRQVTDHTEAVSQPTVIDSLRLVSWQARNLLMPSDWELFPDSSRWLWVVAGGTWLVFSLFRRSMLKESSHRAIYSLCAVSILFYLAAIQVIGGEMLASRHFAPAMIPLLLATVCLAWEAGGQRGVAVWVLLIGVTMGVAGWQRTHRLAKYGDWRRAADFVMQHESTGEPIVLFKPPAVLGFGHYYRGSNVLIPVPSRASFEEFNVKQYVLHNESDVASPISRTQPVHDSIWVIRYGARSNNEITFGAEHLDRFFDRHYTVAEEKRLFGTTVTRYRRPRFGMSTHPEAGNISSGKALASR